MKYKVLKPFFKLSEKKNYSIGDTIDLSKDEAQDMVNDGFLELESKEAKLNKKDKTLNPNFGTEGISTIKTIEDVDAEIKELNKDIVIEEKAFTVSTKATESEIEALPKANK